MRRGLQRRAMPAECAHGCKGAGHVGSGQEPACVRCVPVSRSKGEGMGASARKRCVRRSVGWWVAALGRVRRSSPVHGW